MRERAVLARARSRAIPGGRATSRIDFAEPHRARHAK